MKKKIVALSLVVAMVVMNNVVAWGADTTWNGSAFTPAGGNEKEVKVKFTSAETEKYSVDITWESMVFNYAQGEWKPSDHTYDTSTWSVDAAVDNNITVTNHSNRSVNVGMSAVLNITTGGTTNNLQGEFKDISSGDSGTDISCTGDDTSPSMTPNATLTRGLLNDYPNAPSCKQELNIKGDVELANHTANQEVSVGKITITLNKTS